MNLSRRNFLGLMAVAPIVFNPHRVIFDMGRSKIWTPPALKIYSLDELNLLTQSFLDKTLGDSLFKDSPIFWGLNRNADGTLS